MEGRSLESGPQHNDLWFIGVILDAFATLAGTGGKQLLRYAAVSKNPWYYPLGLVCTAMIDPAFDISAYGFAAQSIIAPCAGMVVVWNVLIAPCTLGERLTRSRLTGALLICVGTVCVGLYGSHDDVERSVDEYLALFARPAAVAYYILFAVWMGACVVMYRRGTPFVSGFAMGALGGSFAGNMFTTKAVVEMVKTCHPFMDEPCESNPFVTPFPYLFFTISMVLACVSLYMLAVGLRTFEALYMITVFEGFMIISGAISGNVVMNEMEHQQSYQLVLYALSIGVILSGLWVLCRGEQRSSEEAVRMLSRVARDPHDGNEMASSTREMPSADELNGSPKAAQ